MIGEKLNVPGQVEGIFDILLPQKLTPPSPGKLAK